VVGRVGKARFWRPRLSPLATKATEALRLGDFKQAIELFKRLVKQDARPEWRDALAEAYAGRARSSSMSGAEHRKPCESRGSRTVLGARGGAIPPRDSPDSDMEPV
jgi:hypothetical protein